MEYIFYPIFPVSSLGLVSDLETVAVPADTGIPVGRSPRLALWPTSGGSVRCPRTLSCLTRAVGNPLLILPDSCPAFSPSLLLPPKYLRKLQAPGEPSAQGLLPKDPRGGAGAIPRPPE